MEYEHAQYGYSGLLTVVLLAWISWFSLPETFAESTWIGMLVVLLLVSIAAITFWFSRLVVTVANGEVIASFGLGKPRRVIQLSDVVEAHQVRNRWTEGWGVRKAARGWMYNVWGLDAVELELVSDTIFRIGSDEAERLHTAISLSSKR
jgi:hypothetical protein